MRQVKLTALTVALCVAGFMVAQGRDFGLVSIPDALNPQPRPEDVYDCTAMIPLPKGGNINVYHVYEEGATDEADDFYGFSVPDLTERNILSLLASAADQDRLIQLPISGKTWFGCAYQRRSDGESVIYEGAVVVEGAYFVVQFHLPPTQPLDRDVMDILAQIRLRPGRTTKTRKLLDALQGATGLTEEERRDACKKARVRRVARAAEGECGEGRGCRVRRLVLSPACAAESRDLPSARSLEREELSCADGR